MSRSAGNPPVRGSMSASWYRHICKNNTRNKKNLYVNLLTYLATMRCKDLVYDPWTQGFITP